VSLPETSTAATLRSEVTKEVASIAVNVVAMTVVTRMDTRGVEAVATTSTIGVVVVTGATMETSLDLGTTTIQAVSTWVAIMAAR